MTARHVAALAWLVLVWTALWGGLAPTNAVPGAVVGAALLVLFPVSRPPRSTVVRPLRAAWFLLVFLWELFEASVIVAIESVTPNERINEGIVEVEVRGVSPLTVTIVANAISLTPGTLVIEVAEDPARLYVHVLHLRDVEAVRRDIQRLEARAVAAFGPRRLPSGTRGG